MESFQYNIVAQAIDYLVAQEGRAPDLDMLARKFGYEPTHFQKIFKEKVGISPKRMAQFLTYRRAREFLLQGYPTLEAAYQVGMSGTGRLHDLFVACEAASPGIVQKRGEGLNISYGFHPSPLGDLLIAQTGAGVCWVGFVINDDREHSITRMRKQWARASFVEDRGATLDAASQIVGIWRGEGNSQKKLKLDLHGTNFQIQVWRALLKIPAGVVATYQDIARVVADERACRAVGTAVGANPVMLIIPCHRVIQRSGIVENYAWGSERKKIILGLESDRWNETVAKDGQGVLA